MVSKFRAIPAVSDVLADPGVNELVRLHSHNAVVAMVRDELASVRAAVGQGADPPDMHDLVRAVSRRVSARWSAWPQSVINATGVILHTNLGRAPLSKASITATVVAASGYSNLEFDLDTGTRGSRQAHVADLVCQATGAEAAFVVNNNASAVMLGLAAVAAGREVIVSRGEAVEIGGGFRIPDVLRQSGASLVEVGTTNRTYASDFGAAINDRTGAILQVHASNFRVVGFTHEPTTADLVAVGERSKVPVLHDLGSGCLLDTQPYGLAHEPRPQESLNAGVALGFFSGDKLLGGPQAGLIVGKREYVNMVSAHPLARAVRIDKLSMAALSATMLHYIHDEATTKIPVWRMISTTVDELRDRANGWREAAGTWATITESTSAIGGGSLPGETLDSVALRIDCSQLGQSPQATLYLLREERAGSAPVIGRIEHDAVLLDPRTVLEDQDMAVMDALRHLPVR